MLVTMDRVSVEILEEELHYRDLLVQSWRLRSPTIFIRGLETLRKLVVSFNRGQGLRAGELVPQVLFRD